MRRTGLTVVPTIAAPGDFAYNRPGVFHRFANTTDVIATMPGVFADPLSGFGAAQMEPYAALPGGGMGGNYQEHPIRPLRELDLALEDRAEAVFNRILWRMIESATYRAAHRIRGRYGCRP
jgi:hypothetical protein